MTNNIKDKNIANEPFLRFKEFSGQWEEKTLGEIGKFFSGGTPKTTNKEYYDGDIPFIRSGEINSDFTELKISNEGLKNSSAKMIDKGDLLIALYGATSGEIAISKIKGAINQAILCINTPFNKEFIKGIWQKHIDKILKSYLQGGQGNLSAEIVKSLKFYFPTLAEQTKIATFLSKIDERISTQRALIRDLEVYKKGLMQKLFSREIRFPNFSDEWEEKALGEICEKKSSNISANSLEENEGIYKVYGATGFLKNIDFYTEENQYIAIVKDGAGVGRLFLCEPKTSVLGTLDIIQNKNIDLKFLYYFLNTIDFSKYTTGSTIPHIYFKDYKNEKIKVPHLEEQTKIASILSKIDEKIETEQQILENYIAQKRYLLQKMFV